MRNYNSFLRTDEISREPKKVEHWLESFAEKMAVQEQVEKTAIEKTASKTAVEVARHRNETQPSIYDMMSSILSGKKPKFSSVEEAVKDYQERTGLSALHRRSGLNDLAEQIVNAGESDEDDCKYQAASPQGQMNTGNDYDTNNVDHTNVIHTEETNDGAPDLHRHVEDSEDEVEDWYGGSCSCDPSNDEHCPKCTKDSDPRHVEDSEDDPTDEENDPIEVGEDDILKSKPDLQELAKILQFRRRNDDDDDDPDPDDGSASMGTLFQDDEDIAADDDKKSTCPPGVP